MAEEQDEEDVIMKELEDMTDEEIQSSIELFDRFANEEVPNLKEFDDKMHKMIDEMFDKKHKIMKCKRVYKVIVAVAAGIMLIAGIATFAGRADALFAKMMKLVLNDKETYTEIIANKDNQYVEEFEGYYYPHYVPEGFEITAIENMGNMGTLIYHEETGEKMKEISFSFGDFNTISTIDSEGCSNRNVLINNNQGVIYSKGDGEYYILIFQNEEYFFSVEGNVPFDVIINVAQSIKR